MSDGDWTWELTPKAQDDLAELDLANKSGYWTNSTKSSSRRGATHRITVNRFGIVRTRKSASADSDWP
jgi:hypothetical protein